MTYAHDLTRLHDLGRGLHDLDHGVHDLDHGVHDLGHGAVETATLQTEMKRHLNAAFR